MARLDRRFQLIDAVNRLFGGGLVADDMETIRARRRSHIPHVSVPLVGGLVQRVGEALLGRPRHGVTIDEMSVPGAVGQLPVRRYTPQVLADDAPLVVYFHGGGFTIGSPQQYDWLCSMIAADAGAVVASVGYRLAPEHPAPAAVDDAIAASRWLADHREETGAHGPLVLGGDSAGGNLAALAAIAARETGRPEVAGQVLIYPTTDLTHDHPSFRRNRSVPILTPQAMETFREHYLSDGSPEPTDPSISPYHVEDLSGLAPALVQTAEYDPLLDEGQLYAKRLEEAGVPVRVTCYRGVPHGFVSLPGATRLAHQAVGEIVDFIAAR